MHNPFSHVFTAIHLSSSQLYYALVTVPVVQQARKHHSP